MQNSNNVESFKHSLYVYFDFYIKDIVMQCDDQIFEVMALHIDGTDRYAVPNEHNKTKHVAFTCKQRSRAHYITLPK